MYEATRLAYLEALGVTNWIPREPLAVAPARTPALLLPEPEASAPEVAGLRAERPAAAPRIEVPRPVKPSVTPVPSTPPAPPPAPEPVQKGPAAEPVAAFYLQLWQSGPCMLLIETPEPGLESAMPGFILLQDILRAVQLPDRPTLVGDFRWPLNRNPQLDRSAAAANRGLLAFLQARLEARQIVSVGCFGAMNTLLVETDLTQADALLGCEESVEGLPPVWFAPSLDSLLKRPQEKAALWTLLRRVRARWQEKS